jgi:hypothetical protein
MRRSAVAPSHISGVALRPVGPRGTTWVPLSIWTGLLPLPCRGFFPFTLPTAAGSPGAHLGGLRHRVPHCTEAWGGPGEEGPGPAVPSPQDGGPQAPPGLPQAGTRRHRLLVGARR